MKIAKIILTIACVAANVSFLYFRWEFSFLSVILAVAFFCVSSTFQGAMHEAGHFFGGRMSGYKLVFLRIGPVVLKGSREGKMSLSIRKRSAGQCVMLPEIKDRIKYKAYNVGGIVSNIIITLGSAALLFIDSRIAELIFIELFFAGLFKIIGNVIPQIRDYYPTDGYILKLLRKRPLVQQDYAKYLALYAALYWEEEVNVREYTYDRKEYESEDELLYYNGIQDLLSDLTDEKNEELSEVEE